jgi:hypothetical protein
VSKSRVIAITLLYSTHLTHCQGTTGIASISTPSKRKPAPDPFEYLMTGPPLKRRQSGVENVPTAREIRPKASNGGSPNPASSMPTTLAKKRGRPSKADAERKHLEAIQRGEVIPPAHINPAGFMPTTLAKKRGRPSKADAERKQLEAIQRGGG